MHGLAIKNRKLTYGTALSKDLALHMSERQLRGNIAVVTDKPVPLLSATRKQWMKLIRKAQRSRSSTLDPRLREEITNHISRLQLTSFSAKDPIEDEMADVCFSTVKQFLAAPPICMTIYFIGVATKEEKYLLASWVHPRGMVVIYEER